jgi:hypothetical protein
MLALEVNDKGLVNPSVPVTVILCVLALALYRSQEAPASVALVNVGRFRVAKVVIFKR